MPRTRDCIDGIAHDVMAGVGTNVAMTQKPKQHHSGTFLLNWTFPLRTVGEGSSQKAPRQDSAVPVLVGTRSQ